MCGHSLLKWDVCLFMCYQLISSNQQSVGSELDTHVNAESKPFAMFAHLRDGTCFEMGFCYEHYVMRSG